MDCGDFGSGDLVAGEFLAGFFDFDGFDHVTEHGEVFGE